MADLRAVKKIEVKQIVEASIKNCTSMLESPIVQAFSSKFCNWLQSRYVNYKNASKQPCLMWSTPSYVA